MQEYAPLFPKEPIPNDPKIPQDIIKLGNQDIPQLEQMVSLARAFLTQQPGRLTAEERMMMQEIIRQGDEKIPQLNAVVEQFLTSEEVEKRRPR